MKITIGGNRQDLGRLWLIAPPFLIGILSPILLSQFFIGASGPKAPCWDYDTVSGGGAAAGIGVSTTFCLLAVASLAAILLAMVCLYREIGKKGIGWYVIIAYFVLVGALVVGFWLGSPLMDDLGKDAFRTTVGSYLVKAHTADGARDSIATCQADDHANQQQNAANSKPSQSASTGTPAPAAGAAPSDPAPPKAVRQVSRAVDGADEQLKSLTTTITVSGFFGVLVTVAMALAVVALSAMGDLPNNLTPIGTPPALVQADRDTLNAKVRDLATRISHLKYLAFVAATVLVTGAAFLKAWADWPLAFWTHVDKDDAKALAFVESYKTVEGAVLNFQGAFFALLMFAIFVPVAFLLSARGQALSQLDPDLEGKPENRAAWLTNRGLSLTVSEQIQRVLVILSPLLAAPIATLVTQVIGLAVGK